MKRAGTCARNTPAIRAFLVQNMPPEWSGTFLKHHFLDPIRILKILIYSLFKPFVLCPKVIKSKILALWWTKARQVGGLTRKCMDQCRKIRNLSSVKGHMSRWYTKLVPYIMDINAMAFSDTLAASRASTKNIWTD
jgi:hypothetical protein